MGTATGKLYHPTTSPSLQDQTVVVTGATSSIGRATATALSRKGAHVVILARNVDKAAGVIRRIETEVEADNPTPRLSCIQMDLNDIASVKKAADEVADLGQPISILVNNAAGLYDGTSAQGYEQNMAVNHLGHFALTSRLIQRKALAEGARVVMLSSAAYNMTGKPMLDWDYLQSPGADNPRTNGSFARMRVYADTKWMNLLFAHELSKRWTGGTAYSVSPGGVYGDSQGGNLPLVFRWGMRWFAHTPEQGCEAPLWAALHPDIESMNGKFFEPATMQKNTHQELSKPYAAALDAAGEALWTQSLALAELDDPCPAPASAAEDS